MIGAIIGDIAGSRFEFSNTFDYDFEIFSQKSSYTDDTVCTVAVADAILKAGGESPDYKRSMLKWCRKYPYPMGAYGNSFSNWFHSDSPRPYGSFGNGAAMRVSPVGWAYEDEDSVMRQAMRTAEITHNHREGLIGASVVAQAIFRLRSGAPVSGVVDSLMPMCYGRHWRDHLSPKGRFNETCQGTVPVAFHLLSQSASFEDAIRRAVSYGGDSDTLGAIVGSMAEAAFPVPDAFITAAVAYLPADMRAVVEAFRSRFLPSAV